MATDRLSRTAPRLCCIALELSATPTEKPCGDGDGRSRACAVQLLIEALRVECVRSRANATENRQGDKSADDRLHDWHSLDFERTGNTVSPFAGDLGAVAQSRARPYRE